MGVSGVGKTSVGEALAARLGWRFHDGDDYHPSANVRKMAAGRPLTDSDRETWLETIHGLIVAHEARAKDAIIACSALKEDYRSQLLRGAGDTRIVHLRGSRELIAERLKGRRGHYFDVGLLDSQFVALEPPADCLIVDVDAELESVVAAVEAGLDLGV